MRKFFILALALGALTLSTKAAQAAPFQNLADLRESLGFDLLESRAKKTVRVAILDKDFSGYKKEVGKSLPSNTVYIPGPVEAPAEIRTEHGFRMAQILTAMYSKRPAESKGLELYLYNVYGFTNFQSAVQDLIQRKVDVVLYSEVWEYGGNLDGKGFINAEVSKATRKGILWVNAVGNFAQTTYNGPINTLKEDRVELPDEDNHLRIQCRAARGETCPLRAVLSWNDFKDDPEQGTDKDLDLELVNSMYDRIAVSELRQSKKPLGDSAPPGASNYPRETIIGEIKSGISYLKVRNYSKNFGSKDRLRITVDGENLYVPSGDRVENILVPADHPDVIAVGATDSERSGSSRRLQRPDIVAPSSVVLADGNEFRGSSNSAAITAAAVALMKRSKPGLTRKDFLRSFDLSGSWSEEGLPLQWLRFGPENNDCFEEGVWKDAPFYVRDLLARGGKLVATTAGWRVMVPYDPVILDPRLSRNRDDDMIVALPDGYVVASRYEGLPRGAVEVFQRPQEAGLCAQVPMTHTRFLSFTR